MKLTKLIKLNAYSNDKSLDEKTIIYVNASMIHMLFKDKDKDVTLIEMQGRTGLLGIEETPEQIISMIEGIK